MLLKLSCEFMPPGDLVTIRFLILWILDRSWKSVLLLEVLRWWQDFWSVDHT